MRTEGNRDNPEGAYASHPTITETCPTRRPPTRKRRVYTRAQHDTYRKDTTLSIRLMDAALNLPLDHASKLVLVVLADHANNDGDGIYPGNKRIARRASLDVRRVQRCLQHLESHSLVEHVRYAEGGRGKAVEWSINTTMMGFHQSVVAMSSFGEKGDICARKGCHLARETTTLRPPQPSGTIIEPRFASHSEEEPVENVPARLPDETATEWMLRTAAQR